ncbi:response regulator [Kangiella sp. TOML190]|uniref:response regulator n=1 Tax=Kangiella sp. TOML190 TaxID=2931351 RepID=UPI00203E23D2|nr:response regulator [Kangiella sp. TOML190]
MDKPLILLVDDDSSIRWVLSKALSNAGFKVVAADNGQEALKLVAKEPPKVLITDVQMPGISGLELMETVKNRYPQLPVVIITANTDTQMAVESHQIGAFDYLPKPFDLNQAVSICQKALALDKPQPLSPWQQQLNKTLQAEYHQGNTQILQSLQTEFEQFMVQQALELCQGHKQKAAKLLGWGRNTLTRKLQSWQLEQTTPDEDNH